MAIYYRSVTVGTEPVSPAIGDIWFKLLTNTDWQGYIWLIDEWILFIGSSSVEQMIVNPDTCYFNVVIQENAPDTIIQTGWIWIKASIKQAYLYLFGDYILFAGA